MIFSAREFDAAKKVIKYLYTQTKHFSIVLLSVNFHLFTFVLIIFNGAFDGLSVVLLVDQRCFLFMLAGLSVDILLRFWKKSI
jgi:hypothetical protein